MYTLLVSRHLPYNRNLLKHARDLRKNMTVTEKKLWNEYLRLLDVKVYRQRPIDNFIVDFYVLRANLVIEVDGDSHFLIERKAKDFKRTLILQELGRRVIRFTNREVLGAFEGVCFRISEALQ